MIKIVLSLMIITLSLQAEEIYATFNVEARKSANLAFIATGIVNKVNVEIGSLVKEGEVLAELKNRDTKAMLDVAKTSFKYAKKDLTRQKKVKKLIDEGKFDAVLNKYESAKDSLVYQQVLYDKTFLKAPFEGVIYDKALEVGDAVSGQALRTVLKIQSVSERKIVLAFDQKYHKMVKVGQVFKYKLDGDETEYKGTISKVYPYANHNNRKIRAEVKARDFMVGLFGEGYILLDALAEKK
ncbi:MAG TPA: efflux RND transporter periplasmic adaptor subunit [Sulfurovum sp.]|nr:efflux RND transporter periplasmic adaptor subunit [Sulfurovum sp.]